MNVIISKERVYQICIYLLIVGSGLSDFLNGIFYYQIGLDFSFGILFRVVFLFFGLLAMGYASTKEIRLFIFISSTLFVVFLISWMAFASNYNVSREIYRFVRTIYLYFPLLLLIRFEKASPGILHKSLYTYSHYAFFIAATIIFSFISGVGITTYSQENTFGVKSFYIAQNDIGLALLFSCVMVLYLYFSTDKFYYFIVFILTALALVFLGTRTSTLGAPICFISFMGYMMINSKVYEISSRKKMLFAVGTFTVGSYIAFRVYQFIIEYPYFVRKIEQLLSGEARGPLLSAGQASLEERSVLFDFIGEGLVSFGTRVAYHTGRNDNMFESTKLVESNFYDFLGAYGYILGGLLLFFPITIFFLRNLVRLISRRNLITFSFFIATMIFFGHSFIAGHALDSPVVTSITSLVFAHILTDSRTTEIEKA